MPGSRLLHASMLASLVLVAGGVVGCSDDESQPASTSPGELEPEARALLSLPGVSEVDVTLYPASASADYLAMVEMEAGASAEQTVAVLDVLNGESALVYLSLGPGAVDEPDPEVGLAVIDTLGGSHEQRVLMVAALAEARALVPPETEVSVGTPSADTEGRPATGGGLSLPALRLDVGATGAEAVLEPAGLLQEAGMLERLDEVTVRTSSGGGSSVRDDGTLVLGGAGVDAGLDAQALAAYERLTRVPAPVPWLGRSELYVAVRQGRSVLVSLDVDVVRTPPTLDRAGRTRTQEALWRSLVPALDVLAELPPGSSLATGTGVADPAYDNPVRDVEVHVSLDRGADTGRGRSDAWSERAERYLRERGALR